MGDLPLVVVRHLAALPRHRLVALGWRHLGAGVKLRAPQVCHLLMVSVVRLSLPLMVGKGHTVVGHGRNQMMGHFSKGIVGHSSYCMVGYRGDRLVGHRGDSMVGKRGNGMVGKRGDGMVGKRGDGMVGKRGDGRDDVGADASNMGGVVNLVKHHTSGKRPS